MWAKLLMSIRTEDGIIAAGAVVWLRRAGKVASVFAEGFQQRSSVMTFETKRGLLLVLPDAEGVLWEQADEPRSVG